MPNADTNGRIIQKHISKICFGKFKIQWYLTLSGQLRYLSLLKYVDGMIGNSSSGLIEAPSFKIGTINIGERQRGGAKSRQCNRLQLLCRVNQSCGFNVVLRRFPKKIKKN